MNICSLLLSVNYPLVGKRFCILIINPDDFFVIRDSLLFQMLILIRLAKASTISPFRLSPCLLKHILGFPFEKTRIYFFCIKNQLGLVHNILLYIIHSSKDADTRDLEILTILRNRP